MIPNVGIVYYHPKDIRNLTDLLVIAKLVNAIVYVIPRAENLSNVSNLQNKYEWLNINFNLNEILQEFRPDLVLVFETYGKEYLERVHRSICSASRILMIFGAEDYGIPYELIADIKNKIIVRIPMKPCCYSYNIVTSATIAIVDILTMYKLCRSGCLSTKEFYQSDSFIDVQYEYA